MRNGDVGILIVDDEVAVRDSLSSWFAKDGYRVDTAADGLEALQMLSEKSWEIALIDLKMPQVDGMELLRRMRSVAPDGVVVMITAYATVETAIEALKEGAFDYVMKPIDPDDLGHIIGRAIRHFRLKKTNQQQQPPGERLPSDTELIGDSPQMQEIHGLVDTVSQTDCTVLIRGESGTGKELIARLIHAKSPRRRFPIVPLNCGAMTETLLESELFGHEKGAFTGALNRHKGKLEIANGGTLFLDEIGTIAPKTQVDLLRVLETKEFTRLGGNKLISVDFRVICATNQDLEQIVREGCFREDLYYRINVFEIQVPPLRERQSDIRPIVDHFVKKYARQLKKPVEGLTPEAMEAMEACEWRGNVRELQNAVERAVVVCRKPQIGLEDLPIQPVDPTENRDTLDEMGRRHIERILQRTEWNITKSARILGIDRVTLYSKIKRYGLSKS